MLNIQPVLPTKRRHENIKPSAYVKKRVLESLQNHRRNMLSHLSVDNTLKVPSTSSSKRIRVSRTRNAGWKTAAKSSRNKSIRSYSYRRKNQSCDDENSKTDSVNHTLLHSKFRRKSTDECTSASGAKLKEGEIKDCILVSNYLLNSCEPSYQQKFVPEHTTANFEF